MSLHDSVLRIKGYYYPTVPDEKGKCPSCGCMYGLVIDDVCPDCGQSSYVIFEPALTELNFA